MAGFTIVPYFFSNISYLSSFINRERAVLYLLLFSIASFFIGAYNLETLNRIDLHLVGDVSHSYWLVGSKKLLQILYITSVFYVFSSFPQNYFAIIRRNWLIGFILSLSVHLIVYVTRSAEYLPRAGTFEEGNFAGLYYILTGCLLMSDERSKIWQRVLILLTCAFGVLLTESTVGIVTVIFIFALFVFLRASNLFRLYALMILFVALLGAYEFNINNFNEKLFNTSPSVENISKYDRIQSFEAGKEIFSEYPLLGVGIEAYGFVVNDKLDQSEFKFYNFDFRRIPNNVYIELLSQLGVVGFSIHFLMFIHLFRKLKTYSLYLYVGLCAILLYWVAFPSFSVGYIWAYLGFCQFLINQCEQKNNREDDLENVA